jgi:hypothetical protein
MRFGRLVDWPYASTLLLTVGGMLALILWARQVPLAKADIRWEDIPERLIDVALPDPELRMEAERELAALDARPGSVVEKTRDAPGRTTGPVQHGREKPEITDRGLLKLLVAKGPGGSRLHPALADVFEDGSAAPDGGSAFENLPGFEIAMTPTPERRPGRAPVPRLADIEHMETRGDTSRLARRAKTERRLVAPGPVEVEADPEDPGASRRPGDIVRVVQRRIGGIKHCYERRLLRDPGTRGKIVVRFEIHPGGRVLVVEIVENTTADDALAACVARRVKAIRFPPCGGDTTSVTYPFVLDTGDR